MKGVSEEEFAAWLASPLTHAFRLYCADRSEFLGRIWRAGDMNAGTMEQIALNNVEQSAAAQVFDEIANLQWRDIERFYDELRSLEAEEEDEEKDDDESDEAES